MSEIHDEAFQRVVAVAFEECDRLFDEPLDLEWLIDKTFTFQSSFSLTPIRVVGGVDYIAGISAIRIYPTVGVRFTDVIGTVASTKVLYFETSTDIILNKKTNNTAWIAVLENQNSICGNILI